MSSLDLFKFSDLSGVVIYDRLSGETKALNTEQSVAFFELGNVEKLKTVDNQTLMDQLSEMKPFI